MGVLITESTDLGTLDDRLANLAAKHDVRIGLAVMVHRDRWEVRAKFESEGERVSRKARNGALWLKPSTRACLSWPSGLAKTI